MTTKKTETSSVFRPTPAFGTCVGFHVMATLESLDGAPNEDQKALIGHAWESDGYEVVFIGPREALIALLGQQVDIPGHAIIGYSGTLGAWGLGRIRTGKEATS